MASVTTEVQQGISDIVGSLTDPIIAYPGGWGDTIPEWLKHAITVERMAMVRKGEEITGTDAEACAYLYTALLCSPVDQDWSDIYLYIAGRVHSRHHDGAQVPEDIRVESISDYQMGDLRRLKRWIYERRVRDRQEKDRADRRDRREEEAARKKAEKPVLFEF
ncbi:MAG: hypothetical protein E3J46_07665 [Desulfobacteraceae bacterium]|nr:MAG: hypothetical protein E3J46_07665 [Desulfobacteraceae bacterium]